MRLFAGLVRTEMGRQLRGSPLIITVVAVMGFRVATTWQEMPVWPRDLADTAVSSLAIGAGLMLVTSASILRERSADVADFLESLPLTRRKRITAVLCASLLVAFTVSACTTAVQVGSFLLDSVPGGHFRLLETLTGIAAALLMAVVGVALACWLPSPISAPLAIALVFWGLLAFPGMWLLPVVPDQHLLVSPPRPPITHLLYVLAVTFLACAVATLRPRPRLGPALAVALAASLVVSTALLTLRSPQAQASAAREDPHRPTGRSATADATVCDADLGLTFCALPTFAAWIPLWEQAVAPVVHALPEDVRMTLPDVIQEIPVGAVDPDVAEHHVFVSTHWGRHGGEAAFRRALAGQLAAVAVGLPGPKSSQGAFGCQTNGQARVVVALWLLSLVESPQLPQTSQQYIEDDRGESRQMDVSTSDLGFVTYGKTELDYAVQLRRTPGVEDRIRAHWAELTAPRTTLTQAADMLGVPAPSAASSADAPRPPAGKACT